jgi:hypothetical protein
MASCLLQIKRKAARATATESSAEPEIVSDSCSLDGEPRQTVA